MSELRRRLQRMSHRDRRALTLGALLLIPLLTWGLGVRPWMAAVEELRDRSRVEQGLLARERAALREAPDLPARLEGLAGELRRHDARLVRAGNLALAEAEVAARLQAMARTHRVHLEELRGVQPRPGAEPPPGLAAIRLSLRGESDFQGVLDFVHALEADDLLLGVESLSIQPLAGAARPAAGPGGSSGGAPGGGQGGASLPPPPGTMTLLLVVEAYAPAELLLDSLPDPAPGVLP
jgi:hypothetical protein